MEDKIIEILEEELTLDKATEEIKSTGKEQWIQIFPKGSQYIEKYNKEFNFNIEFTKEIEKSFLSPTLSKPVIDKDHGFSKGDTRSYGDILGFKDRQDAYCAKIKLNKEGRELIESGAYKYISPFCKPVKDTKGTFFPVKCVTLSLTNYPALEGALNDLQSQLALDKEWVKKELNIGGNKMELTNLITVLSLSNDATIDTVFEAVKKLQLDKKTVEDEVIKLSAEIDASKKEKLETEGRDFIKEQIKLGKMTCSEIVQKIELSNYIANPEERKEYFKAIPEKSFGTIDLSKVIVDGGASLDGISLTKEEMAKMIEFDYDPKVAADVRAFKLHYIDKKKKGGVK